MSIEATMAGYYADRAREYEAIYLKPERQPELRELRQWVESHFAGADVFEVACGTGYWTERLAQAAAAVLATDINPEVLAVARGKALDPARVTFQEADAYQLPDQPRRYSAGFSGFWWSHIPKPRLREFLRGFHRVLTPAARVMLMDNVYVAGSSTPISRVDEAGNTYQQRRLQDGRTHEIIKNFPVESELRAAVEGLATAVQVTFRQYYWVMTYEVTDGQSGN